MAQVANTLNGPFGIGGALWDILHGIMANIPILKDISSFKKFLARVVNGLCLGTLPGGGNRYNNTYINPGDTPCWPHMIICRAANNSNVYTITEKAPTRCFSWLKAPNIAFTF